MIASSDGNLVRPMAASGEGPLAQLEKTAVEFLERVKFSEMERLSTRTLRPKDLDESKRGPLGDAEAKLSDALTAIREPEAMRRSQMSLRGGEAVRPIDVPGPIGGVSEGSLAEIVRAEQERVRETQDAELNIVRPKDAKLRGPSMKGGRGSNTRALAAVTKHHSPSICLLRSFSHDFTNYWFCGIRPPSLFLHC